MYSFLRFLPALLLIAAIGTAQAASDSVIVPGQWIVELESPAALAYRGDPGFQLEGVSGKTAGQRLAATAPDVTGAGRYDAHTVAARAYTSHLDQERSSLLARVEQTLGRSLEPTRRYRHVFNGFVANMDAHEAARLAGLPGVRSVEPVMAFRMHLDAGPSLIGARIVHIGGGGLPASGGEGVVIGVIDNGINWDSMYFSDDDLMSGHAFSNPLGRQLGLCSQSGVNCNNKLIGVYDFTDEGTRGKDPAGHGSHVAGIAAGVPIQLTLSNTGNHIYRTTGVAPHANIVSYKVCYGKHPSDSDLDDTCDSGAIMEAWEQAVIDGVDVVNYSIGSSPLPPWAVGTALLNLWSAGIPFVTSAGNEGPDAGTIGFPANVPWAFTVGSSTHGRLVGQRVRAAGIPSVLVVYGGGPAPAAGQTAPLVAADSPGENMLACQAFPGGSLAGAVVLIERGDCTFELKVHNAASAGAVAVLMYNNLPGPPIAMGGLEASSIPAAMTDFQTGQQIRGAINRTTNPTATLTGEGVASTSPAWRDLISDFSSRGPADYAPGILKPNVVAPGSDILSAYFDGVNSIGFSSGTSMASPHVAGAVALLQSIHPDWGPDRLQSVLETTADANDLRWNNAPAGVNDRGAGRIQVDRALRAGLYLPITRSQFEAADPASGGDPASLNLAGMWGENCDPTCSFTRRVRALESGNWLVSAESTLPVTVSPDTFSLSAGQEQVIEITVDTMGLVGPFVEAAVFLTPTGGDLVEQKLTVGITLPSMIDRQVDTNRGSHAVSLAMDAMPEPVFYSSALERPARESFVLDQDPSPESPYQGTTGRRTFLYDVDEESLMLWAEVVSSEARDIDLFVGRDDNGDGRANEDEERCRSMSPTELETCIIENPEPGTWWVLVQNWQASPPGASNRVDLDVLVAYPDSDPSLVATGPGRHEGGVLPLMVHWDQPEMRWGERRLGAIGISSSPDQPADRGVLPVRITRQGNHSIEAAALFAGETLPVIVPGSARHDLLFIDLPPQAERLQVQVQGDADVSASLHRLDFDAIADHAPDTPPAPDTAALLSGSGSAAGISLNYQAAPGVDLEPGRYYVVLENAASGERLVNVTASIEENAASLPRFGLWGPADRTTYQGIEWNVGGAGMIVWYSYDEQGLPTFYNAVEAIDPQRSTWAADLLRTTASTEARQNIDTVGRVAITALGSEELIMSWRLNGHHGSERLTPDVATSCAEVNGVPTSYSGLWYAPTSSQGGTTMIVTADSQAQVRYYFDLLGVGRWVITTDAGGAGPLAEQLDVLELRGFCPGCAPVEVSIETVGSYVRQFQSEDRATEILEFQSRPPLNQHYSNEVSIHKLTSRRDCQ